MSGLTDKLFGRTSNTTGSGRNTMTDSNETASRTMDTTSNTDRNMGTNIGNAAYDNTRRDDAMTRSEERLNVGKEIVNKGSVALEKTIQTEHVKIPVPITREHVVVEREPITSGNIDKAMRGPELREARHQVNLTEERAVASKETVPVERVRLNKLKEHTEDVVSADLRKEHIDVSSNLGGKTLESTTTNNPLQNNAQRTI